MKLKHAFLIILVILIIDQWSKIYIKTNFVLNEKVEVFSWFQILFIENEGAAWGTKIPGEYGKLFLTLFRIIAVFGIGYWLFDSVKKKQPNILIVSIALILAGALGNIIDSVFYGVIFDHSYGNVATLFSDNPYGTLLHGKVVDMFYFPLIDTQLPDWFPFWGGERFRFFEPVFNVADSAISVAVGLLIIFHKKAFPKK
ncbi:lipoprotein signal peptidase [Capnocytophaga stomatis]|uniref:Lipoprotein signal peptidase n=1 Tax=Capnocytophaga stomatis TaxID=1848904 RepID=A0A250FV63_9FLAO|nr:lipoprotein signal peptidase [Capnocytophaga stomatis]ATA88911.1 lipoprotein signal peptidase [Capnocytophaga stomatis]GIJ95717.1 lipoprotein signal peptidase [Capnocytophaga stomatis]GIM48903.1 lipoprotein signal peptidase [Capnocytophaga stomatis]